MSTESLVNERPQGIYTRIMNAVQARGVFYSKATNAGVAERGSPELPAVLFLGRNEWAELEALCEAFGVNWAGAAPGGYKPDVKRAEFMSFKIYCVDAQSFLVAL